MIERIKFIAIYWVLIPNLAFMALTLMGCGVEFSALGAVEAQLVAVSLWV